MAERTGISWTDHTWNPWWGCQKVSPGCDHCYAEALVALERAATPGPWVASRGPEESADTLIRGPDQRGIARTEPAYGRPHAPRKMCPANAALIAAMRNHLPALLADVARLTRDLDEARAALEERKDVGTRGFIAGLIKAKEIAEEYEGSGSADRADCPSAAGAAEVAAKIDALCQSVQDRTALSTPASGEREQHPTSAAGEVERG